MPRAARSRCPSSPPRCRATWSCRRNRRRRGPAVNGDFSLVGPKLRETLAWLAIDTSSLPPDKLTKLSLKGQLGSSGGAVQVKNAAFELDDVKGTGGVTVTFSVPLSIVTQIDIDTVDLDSYLAKPAGSEKKPAAPAPAAASRNKAPDSVFPSIGLKLKIAKAIYNKQTIGGIQANLALKGRTISFDDISVSNLGGARFAVRGNVTDFDRPSRRFDVAFNFEAPDLAPVLKVAGATAPDTLGKVTAKGGVSGTVEAMTFRELEIVADGQTARIDGTLTMPGAAKGPPSTIGYKGKVTANGQTIEGTVEAKVADRPSITADLRTSLLDLDKFGGTPAPAAAARQAAGRGCPRATRDADHRHIAAARLRCLVQAGRRHAGQLAAAPEQRRHRLHPEGRRAHRGAREGRASMAARSISPARSTAASPRWRSTSRATPRASISARCCAAPPAPTCSAARSGSRSTASSTPPASRSRAPARRASSCEARWWAACSSAATSSPAPTRR